MERIVCPNCGKAVYSSSFREGGKVLCPHCNVSTPITPGLLEKERPKSES